MAQVAIRDYGVDVEVNEGQSLLSSILEAGLEIVHECGGNGRCGTCSVIVLEGAETLTPPNFPEQEVLRLRRKAEDARLSCRLCPSAPITVQIHREAHHRSS